MRLFSAPLVSAAKTAYGATHRRVNAAIAGCSRRATQMPCRNPASSPRRSGAGDRRLIVRRCRYRVAGLLALAVGLGLLPAWREGSWGAGIPPAALGAATPAGTEPGAAPRAPAPADDGLVALINAFRAPRHLPPLRVSAPLTAAARAKAQDMSRRHYFGHRAPGGQTPAELRRRAGDDDPLASELIAWGYAAAAATLRQWTDGGPGEVHYDALADPRYRVVGCARAPSATYHWVWACELASR